MRLKLAIVLAVLGLLVLGSGIGQRTIWLPPATVTASVPAVATPAPLTVIGSDLLNTRDSQFTMTIKGSGPIQLAVAREGDITGWIGDAAHTLVGGANEDFSALSSESVTGAETVPNPSGSDMWVSEETATGEMSYTWEAPGRGDWALLLSSDGTAPAPTDISISVENEAGTPWAVPLMILGSVLLALAALLFLMSSRKPKDDDAPAGRRSAVRPADSTTGALEVAKIVAARKTAKSAPGPATIAELRQAETTTARPGDKPAGGPGETGTTADATTALPTTLQNAGEPVRDSTAGATTAGATTAGATSAGSTQDGQDSPGAGSTKGLDSKDVSSKNEPKDEPKNGSKDDGPKDDGPDSHNGSDSTPDAGARQGKPARWAAAAKKKAAQAKEARKNDGTSSFTAATPKRGMKSRWGAALAAVLLALSASPAVAVHAAPPAPTPEATDTTDTTAGFPNLLDSQVQRIAAAVATVVASGDNAMDAKELEPRVFGMALDVRAANYRIRSAVETHPAAEPVNATEMLAKVVTTTQTWPRSAMFVTKGENNELPQLLTLVQASPRENYKLIKATPLLPGQTLPTVDKEGTTEVALEDATDLLMSPAAAVAALSDRLTKEDSEFTDSFKDSIYVTSVFDLKKKVVADAADADLVFSHKPNIDSIVSLRTADGGAMVVVGSIFGIDATSKENATLAVSADAAVFTGGAETTTGFTLGYAEPIVLYIPPTTGEDQMTILSATRDLVGGKFK